MATNEEAVELESFSDDDDDNNTNTNTNSNNTGGGGQVATSAQQRLQNARQKLNDARKRNHQQVIEENKRSRIDPDAVAKERRRVWREKQEELKKEAEARGLDPQRAKLLHTTVWAAERHTHEKKQSFEWDAYNDEAQFRLHKKQVDKLSRTAAHADADAAAADVNAAADPTTTDVVSAAAAHDQDAAAALDPTRNPALLRTSAPREQALNKLVDSLHATAEKRAKFSRRRTEHQEADVDFINDKNKIFNKKLSKAYDAYSSEIRQNLERGSAI